MPPTASSYLTPDLHRLLADKARSFSFAARFLPSDQRDATRVLYAFCRTMDDLVDEPTPGSTPEDARQRLRAWRDWLSSQPGVSAPTPEPSCLATALAVVIDRYALPTSYLIALVDGVESDLGPVRMRDFPSLRRYCILVAGVVGLAMCHLVGATSPAALVAAANLGIAMQLTNVLRDVGSDLRRDRVYLPADDLAEFGHSEQSLRALVARGGRADDAFRMLMRHEIARARLYYARGMAGIWLLPPQTRVAILSAGRIYRAILDRIERNDYDVLRRRAYTSGFVKTREALIATLLVALSRGQRIADDQPSGDDLLADDEIAQWIEPSSIASR